jgi:hypothetical protein
MFDLVHSICEWLAVSKRDDWLKDVENVWVIFRLRKPLLISWLRERLDPRDHEAMSVYFSRNAKKCKEQHMVTYVRNGWLGAIQRAHSNGHAWAIHLSAVAAERGHLHVLRWLRARCYPIKNTTFMYAAYGGHIHVLRWMCENGFQWDEAVCEWAALAGHLHVLKWARANGLPWSGTTCLFAAYGGHIHVLKWARQNGCPWYGEDVCSAAAEHGHLETLKWARANGCPWDAFTCSLAAKNGHLDVLKWARENGCPWDELTHVFARQSSALRWVTDHGCPVDHRPWSQIERDFPRPRYLTRYYMKRSRLYDIEHAANALHHHDEVTHDWPCDCAKWFD